MQAAITPIYLNSEACKAARLARDKRFDGLFYTAVISTGIYCRPTCPARAPKEENVRYLPTAAACAEQGFRPCLRCRPDASPGLKPADHLVSATLNGLWRGQTLADIAGELGVSDRHLRAVFRAAMGVSPKAYQTYQRCLLAKQMLYETGWPVTDIAFACGFQSVRRFNAAFKQQVGVVPQQVRKHKGRTGQSLQLFLSYRPPYAWHSVQQFLARRQIDGLEQVTEQGYARSLSLSEPAWFSAQHRPQRCGFEVRFVLSEPKQLVAAIDSVRRILDLDANGLVIDAALRQAFGEAQVALTEGLRVPQLASLFEAGVRAILGQQVSVLAARRLTQTLVAQLGERFECEGDSWRCFPTPQAVADSSLSWLKMPDSRRRCLREFARQFALAPGADPQTWLTQKGIGPWTVAYAKLRAGLSPDIWLAGDLGIKQACAQWPGLAPERAAPWRSYLTFQLWELLT